MLYDRINAQGYEECPGDVQTVSAMVDNIRDAVIDYQVGTREIHIVTMQPKLKYSDRWPCNERYIRRTLN